MPLLLVGLGINCAAWVRAGLISEHDMLDRYWGYWTTFTQVGFQVSRLRSR